MPRGGAGTYNRYGSGAYSYRGYGNRGYGYGGYGYGYRGYGFGYTLGAPYYAFRPRVGLGFGLYIGYPVAYPYWAFPSPYVYGYPYPPAYAYPPAYGYGAPGYSAPYPAYGGAPAADPNSVTAAPETSAPPRQGQPPASGQYGGLSFQLTPDTAQIYVDGVYVGIANQFSATAQPLTLTPGAHHVEVRADGYQSMAFNVNVAPGQVIPYQGTMQR